MYRGLYDIIKMLRCLGWLILIVLHYVITTTSDIIVETPTSTNQNSPISVQPHSTKANEDLEYRLVRLEVLLENLRIEARDSSRRLQALEFQSTEVHSTLKDIRAVLTRIVQQAPSSPATPMEQSNTMSERTVEDLDKDVKILMTATTVLTSDVNDLKKNVSSLITDTRSLLESTSPFVTNKFVNHSTSDLEQFLSVLFPTSSETSTSLPKNCRDVKELGKTLTGVYSIQPQHSLKPVLVVCDLETRGGGWTVIQNRLDGSEDFYRDWQDYKYGFGNLSGEFWLGLDTIHKLTDCQPNELLVVLQFLDLQYKTAYYKKFSVGPEREGFPLKIFGYSGDSDDSLVYHHGQKFTTKDVDQDSHDSLNCAASYTGAWWYKSCHASNLNGKYFGIGEQVPKGSITKGMCWKNQGEHKLLIRTRMLVRPRAEAVCDSF